MCAECTGHLSKSGDSASLKRGKDHKHNKPNQNKTPNKKNNKQEPAEFRSVRKGETW